MNAHESPRADAPLDAREREYLRSKQIEVWPQASFAINAALFVSMLVVLIRSDEAFSPWAWFGFGALMLIALGLSYTICRDQLDLRADLAAGVKRWREGTVARMWSHDDGESWPPGYRIEIAFDPGDDPNANPPPGFSVYWHCYETVRLGDRVRVAYSPKSHYLLNLIDGEYEYAAPQRRLDPHPPKA
ncbi:hypothetical protein J5226_22210 [Lysobacter sp. K5869]|uniref:hypothetical protein n=1 Tax=Lysobacter sp. K5869 TaxID=2820808 RepID=UPI001C06366D|nr:hypothetical protein [Lysobacter sp. K5869]QWP76271.1 hypothetical protein J5226_22210 [Lysobacter sp. K5869]